MTSGTCPHGVAWSQACHAGDCFRDYTGNAGSTFPDGRTDSEDPVEWVGEIMIPGYKLFTMAADLFADLFPDRANEIDGDDKEMVRISEALQEACRYGEEHHENS